MQTHTPLGARAGQRTAQTGGRCGAVGPSGRPRAALLGSSVLTSSRHATCPSVDGAAMKPGPAHCRSRASARNLRVQAVAAPEVAQAGKQILSKEYPLKGNCNVKVDVYESEGGQLITLTTNVEAGRLLLHWGVEGGKNYKGGWRLPDGSCWPEGTKQYKDRALQTPFKTHDGTQSVSISLRGDEASDVINFVLKDDATNTWWDCQGSNFAVNLRVKDAARPIPELPQHLCDTWAWMKWDSSGRPQRSHHEARDEYEVAVAEMKRLLESGRTLDELERVARGEPSYMQYKVEVVDKLVGSSKARVAVPVQSRDAFDSDTVLFIPDELIALQAYKMWEEQGQPQGADFGAPARNRIEGKLRKGMTLDSIRRELKGEPQQQQQQQQEQQQQQQQERKERKEEQPQQAEAAAPAPPKKAEKAEMGESMGVAKRDPLDLIKPPSLSEDKRAPSQESPLEFIVQRAAVDPTTRWRRTYQLGDKQELLVTVKQPKGPEGPTHISIISDTASSVVLHWGVCKPGSRDWLGAPDVLRPEGTKQLEGAAACETTFVECNDDECDVEVMGAKVPLQRIQIVVPPGSNDVAGLTFVLRSSDSTRWYRDANGNFFVPLPTAESGDLDAADPMSKFDNDLTRTIAEDEINSFHWTLMHRYNKAADLINGVLDGFYEVDIEEAMADIYVWLRYSSTRQLTWQRNYNTQPRILSAAQERLTNTIAAAHKRTAGEAQEWVRSMLTTVGRGGDGQRIRDEILHIMHRNNIKEVKGTWMEEWHQKLHNNTTPDDVPICQAYLAFLRGNGDIGAYWRVLSDAGIDRQRLESFDRAIKCEPEFFADKKDTLIGEFTNYLGILKAVHSGADLQASAAAVGNSLPGGARGHLGYVTTHIGDSQILPFVEAAVEARTEIAPSMNGNRDLLYLDLALENAVRAAAERGVGGSGFGAAALMAPLLQNLALSRGDNEEVCFCLKAWQGLPRSVRKGGRPNREEALQAVAVVNRIRRAISQISDEIVERITPFSLALGRAAKCDSWAVEVFAEEVVRGGPAFAVSLLISNIEPALRAAAELGAWQVISPQAVTGRVEVVDHLSNVQDKVYDDPTVLVVENVTGEEEIPEGVVGLLTPDAPDVLSHVSVRARNMKVLFATCHDNDPLEAIRKSKGEYLHFNTTAAGAVTWVAPSMQSIDYLEGGEGADGGHKEPTGAPVNLKISIPKWCGKWVVAMDEFEDGRVGAKSKNIANLRGKIPDWIKLPAAVTVPFGSFEEALKEKDNQEIATKIQAALEKLSKLPKAALAESGANGNGNGAAPDSAASLLAKCRELAMQVKVPAALREELAAKLEASGIPVPENEERWGLAMDALKGVWASKYNDRAFYSLKKIGIDVDAVRMAVCIMRVVPARYAFVIHTKNPSNNDASEVFCEMVKGLGESLVSGMVPGSSIAFTARKDDLDHPETLAYASKSEGMFVRESLIFRSDSNGEDLEGYAGAGLYESITMDPSELKRVDYNDDSITSDPDFRRKVFSDVAKVGAAIEEALGSAQDIEGVVDPDGTIHVVQTRPQV